MNPTFLSDSAMSITLPTTETKRNYFITGGAGFIGSNLVYDLLNRDHQVTIFDNLSRPGSEINLNWLRAQYGSNLVIETGDVRDSDHLRRTVAGSDVIVHLAGQVAVTTSVLNPREDFEINALGTLNVLEAVRLTCPQAVFINASTNKVYGGMKDVRIEEHAARYDYADFVHGIPETYPLDFHSPYGCSKGAADQYTIDYARIYDLNTVTLRQSCIYGPRQFGVEDQGWVAHFAIAASRGDPISIYGDGKQLRDLLHISDLVRAYNLAVKNINEIRGKAINLGGGPKNTISIWSEFGPILEELAERRIEVNFKDWRPGDQRVFYADINRAAELLDWRPKIAPRDGLAELYTWVKTL